MAETASCKEAFIALVKQIKRDPIRVEKLIKFLEQSDFFEAPASSKYHGAFTGGLCAHSLHVYNNMVMLVNSMPGVKEKIQADGIPLEDLNESLIITALFHDIAKTNFYEVTSINKKVYRADGTKRDSIGNFEWESERGYKIKDASERFIFGTHGQNSERIISSCLPLYDAESCAIINHHSVYDSPGLDISSIYNRYTLAVILHTADILATYVDEKI